MNYEITLRGKINDKDIVRMNIQPALSIENENTKAQFIEMIAKLIMEGKLAYEFEEV